MFNLLYISLLISNVETDFMVPYILYK